MSKFQVILADNPWSLDDDLKMDKTPRGAISNYSLLNTSELCKLRVSELADPNGCILALWAVGSMLDDAMKVMKAWGFSQKQIYVWVKTKKNPLQDLKKSIRKHKKLSGPDLIKNIEKEISLFENEKFLAFGMGRLFRQTHEICLIGINSTKLYKHLQNKSQRSVSFFPSTKHSVKPENLHNSLEIMFPSANKLEIFGRRNKNGWTVIGNEAPNSIGEDIRDSIAKLILSNVPSPIIKP